MFNESTSICIFNLKKEHTIMVLNMNYVNAMVKDGFWNNHKT